MYFRGSGKAAQMKREATMGAMMHALWEMTYWGDKMWKVAFANVFPIMVIHTFYSPQLSFLCTFCVGCYFLGFFGLWFESNWMVKIETVVVHT
jgi:hypothetical protein